MRRKMRIGLLAGVSLATLLSTSLANAQTTAAAPATAELDVLIVTGTRTTGLRAIDSPAPIQVLDETALARVAQSDLIQAIAQNIPSFNAQAFGGDAANLTLSAKLRGLSPNHALVLINGKRRHGTSNLAVLGGAVPGRSHRRPQLHPAGRGQPHRGPAGRRGGPVRHRRHRRGHQHHSERRSRWRLGRAVGRQVHGWRRPDRRRHGEPGR